MLLATVVTTTISAIPSWRQKVRLYFHPNDREILAKIVTQMGSENETFSIFKIKQQDDFLIEVYKNNPSGEDSFLTKIPLNEKKDAYFNFKGNATNLALSDIDSDGVPELLVPGYDSDSSPRLNIFKFNKDSQAFDLLKEPKN